MKNKKYHTVGTAPKSNRNIAQSTKYHQNRLSSKTPIYYYIHSINTVMAKPILEPKHPVSALVKWLISKSIIDWFLINTYTLWIHKSASLYDWVQYVCCHVFLLVFTLTLIKLPRYNWNIVESGVKQHNP